jgi:hypothetical protein
MEFHLLRIVFVPISPDAYTTQKNPLHIVYMQSTNSRFVSNIVPLQNVQTNVSGQGVQQTILTNITALQAAVTALQGQVVSLQNQVTALKAKVG